MVEAIRFGCFPLLPRRLVYPEIIPPQLHSMVLYEDTGDLVQKLTHLITHYPEYEELRTRLSTHMAQFAWQNLIDRYDEALERLARLSGGADRVGT